LNKDQTTGARQGEYRFLGIDYGTRNIGLAISDSSAIIASPLTTVACNRDLAVTIQNILTAVTDYDISAFVLGLPLNMDGSEGPQAKLTRQFGSALARTTGLPVHYCDERLTTLAADSVMRQANLTRKKRKKRIDKLAAQMLLQCFLDAHPR